MAEGSEPTGADFGHAPVMQQEVIEMLKATRDMDCIDMTTGMGGHAEALLEATAPAGRLLAIDRDADALAVARKRLDRFGSRVSFAHRSFAEARACAEEAGFPRAHAILFDLGASSPQLDSGSRGFSFREDAPLDMRMDSRTRLTAEDIVNTWRQEDLERILSGNGNEPLARGIARAICRRRATRPLHTTGELAGLVSGVYLGRGWHHSKLHPATRTFQALRMAVNDELGALAAGLEAALALLSAGGRMAVLSFHSGEDRMVKQFFKAHSASGRPVTKKPMVPADTECARNPRARSAKLRVFEKDAA